MCTSDNYVGGSSHIVDTSRNETDTRDRNRAQGLIHQGADTARQIGAKSPDTARYITDTAADARRSAEAATDAARRAADQTRQATMAGLRALSGVQGPLTDTDLEQSRQALEITS